MERLVACENGTTLCIDEVGDPAAPLVLQLEGHMAQLVATPRSYCELLARHGLRVVRVDNRDVGRSSRSTADYTLGDLAEDVHHLLAELGRPAVVCGRSMGGAVAQLLALRYPRDVLGLGLFFTYAKEHRSPPQRLGPAPFTDLASFRAWEQRSLPGIAGPAYPFAPTYISWLAETTWERGVSWAGFERQRRAMDAEDPWADRLGALDVPVVVVHGRQDPVVPVTAGRRLAELIPGSELRIIEGLGHQQPPELDAEFVAATLACARNG